MGSASASSTLVPVVVLNIQHRHTTATPLSLIFPSNRYAANSSHFLSDGVSFWWNDEGETDWFTYHWWNTAQGKEWEVAQPGERQFSLNRAFTPGMQRLVATVWSGDGQDCSHQMVLKFLDRGASYSTCDMRDDGDVSGTVLVRQYQNAVFLPLMRVHQMHGLPRFPFLWGDKAHQDAFRGALNTRYAFLPHLYSLGHRLYAQSVPIARRASDIDGTFPRDCGSVGAKTCQSIGTYMVGDSLLPGDSDLIERISNNDPNAYTIAFPPGNWFPFNTSGSPAVIGPQTKVR